MALIDQEEALDALNAQADEMFHWDKRWEEQRKGIPTAVRIVTDIRPKHGEWEYHSNPAIGINTEDAYCSCCGFHVDTTGDIDFDEYNFCPHCGAKMEG